MFGGPYASDTGSPVESSGTPSAYAAYAANFDGTNDYLSRDGELTGLTDSDRAWFAFMVDFNGGDGLDQNIYSSFQGSLNRGVAIQRNSSNIFRFVFYNAGAVRFEMRTVNTYVAASGRLAVLGSFITGGTNHHLYVNDVSDKSVITNTAGTVDFTTGVHMVGRAAQSNIQHLNGCLAEFIIGYGTYVDFSIEANRRKIFTASGSPVSKGSDGSGTGFGVPHIYLGGPDKTVATWPTNAGSGGGFTVNGALTDCADSPWE